MNKILSKKVGRFLTILLILICISYVISHIDLFVLSVMGRIELYEYPNLPNARSFLLSGEKDVTRTMNLGYMQIFLQNSTEIFTSTRILIVMLSFISIFPVILCGYFIIRLLINIVRQNDFSEKNIKYLLYCGITFFGAALLTNPINSHVIPFLIKAFSNNIMYVQYDISHDRSLFALSLVFYVISYILHQAKETSTIDG